MSVESIAAFLIGDPVETLAVITGIVAVYLSTREHIWSWPVALVNVALYAVVFWRTKLYADMGLQVVYFALSVYGWYEWLHGGENRGELHVSRTTPTVAWRLAVIGLASMLLLGTLLARFTDASLPYLDSATTSTSLVAQWMMTRKLLENWAVWIAVDVVYVGMFIYKSLDRTAVLYAIFLVLAVLGHVRWRRSLRADGDRRVPAPTS
jgi:nicotinamide mononucleotide transporter